MGRDRSKPRWRRDLKWVLLIAAALVVGLLIERSEVAEDRKEQVLPADAPPADPKAAPAHGERPVVDPRAPGPELDAAIELQVFAGGKPLPEARVRLFLRGGRDPNTAQLVWKNAGSERTDANGGARFATQAGRYFAVIDREGFANAFAEVIQPVGERRTSARVELRLPVFAQGEVILHKTREKVPLAEVAATPVLFPAEGASPIELPTDAALHATSDAHGRFSFASLGAGLWHFQAHAPGGGKGELAAQRLPAGAPILLELTQAGYIEGHVLVADGSPAANAEIAARNKGAIEPAISNASGAFSIEVSAGNWELTARRGKDAGALQHGLPVAEGETKRGVEIRLGPGAVVAGSVLHKGDSRPLSGAQILLSPHNENGDSARATADANGEFILEGLPPAGYDVVVQLDGFASQELRGIAIGPGQRYEHRFEMSGSGSVAGVVRDAQQRPVEGALVDAASTAPHNGSPQSARTDAEGKYRLDRLPAGHARVIAHRSGSALGSKGEVEIKEGETAQLDLSLKSTGHLAGRVIRVGGSLPEETQVTAVRNPSRGADDDVAHALVAADGSYQLELPAGAYRVYAEVAQSGPRTSRDLIAIEAEETLTHDLQLTISSEIGLTVQVLEPGGAPSAGASIVMLSTTDRSFRERLTADVNGEYAFTRARTDLPDSISFHASNGARAGSGHAAAGDTKVVIQLEGAASLHGKLTASVPIQSFTLAISSKQWQWSFSGAELHFLGDQFELPDLEAGDYTLHATTSDGRTGEATATAGPGGDGEVEIALTPLTSLLGRVVDESGKPVANAQVSIDRGSWVPSDSDGAFRFDGISGGAHHLIGTAPWLSGEMDAQVASGEQGSAGDLVLKKVLQPGMVGLSLSGDSSGVYVSEVAPGSPAEIAGVLAGDQVFSVDGAQVVGISDAIARIRGGPGAPVSLVLQRNGRTFQVQIFRAS